LLASAAADRSAAVSGELLDGELAKQHPRVTGGSTTQPVLDDDARKDYELRIRELEEERDEARKNNDPATEERVQKELTAMLKELSAATGLGGRGRSFQDAVERARRAVANRITRSLKAIKAEGHETLWRHLKNSIMTGVDCRYAPEGHVDWGL